MRSWRESVDPIIRNHLEAQIKETLNYKESYNKAKDKGNAQLWIAVANLSKQILSLELKIKYLENILKEIVTNIREIKNEQESKQKPLEEIKRDKEKKPEEITKETKKKIKKKK